MKTNSGFCWAGGSGLLRGGPHIRLLDECCFDWAQIYENNHRSVDTLGPQGEDRTVAF